MQSATQGAAAASGTTGWPYPNVEMSAEQETKQEGLQEGVKEVWRSERE